VERYSKGRKNRSEVKSNKRRAKTEGRGNRNLTRRLLGRLRILIWRGDLIWELRDSALGLEILARSKNGWLILEKGVW